MNFRARFRSGESLLGSFLKIPSTQPVEILGALGFDFAVVDEEHAPFNRETTDAILLACRAAGIAGIVRVQGVEDVLSALDCGAEGVLIPHVDSPEKAREAVAACRYRGGRRGFSPTTRAGNFGARSLADHLTAEDERVAVVAMIEDAEALDRLDEILATPGLDGIFVGRGDLAVSMGEAGTPEAVAAATAKIMTAARKAGVAVAILPASPEEARKLAAAGASAFLVSSDQGFLRAAALEAVQAFRPALQKGD